MQALVAVMRKLLHAIHGMFQRDADFDGTKFFAENGLTGNGVSNGSAFRACADLAQRL